MECADNSGQQGGEQKYGVLSTDDSGTFDVFGLLGVLQRSSSFVCQCTVFGTKEKSVFCCCASYILDGEIILQKPKLGPWLYIYAI